jgi:hypothetical protein
VWNSSLEIVSEFTPGKPVQILLFLALSFSWIWAAAMGGGLGSSSLWIRAAVDTANRVVVV